MPVDIATKYVVSSSQDIETTEDMVFSDSCIEARVLYIAQKMFASNEGKYLITR